MVVHKNPKACLSHSQHPSADTRNPKASIGILAFEAAAAMSLLVSIHRSLSDSQVRRLRSDGMRSPGVAYLTSTDQHLLLRLACAELVSDLDTVSAAVSRFSSRCRADALLSFPRTYADLKAGSDCTTILPFSVKEAHRRLKHMEKSVAMVSRLFQESEALAEMEAGEKKMALRFGRPLDAERLQADLKAQAKKVARLKAESLWSKSYDEAVALMSRAVLAVFARICHVFGPFVQDLPPILLSGSRMSFSPICSKFRIYPRLAGRQHSSGPMDRPVAAKEAAIRNSCPIIGRGRKAETKLLTEDCSTKVVQADPVSTVVGAALAMRYANVIVMAERMIMRISCGEEKTDSAERDEMYRLLPARLQGKVRGKLRERWRERGKADRGLAEGWREAVERILQWLGPVATDTVRWQEERMLDRRQRLMNTAPRVLALQTLQFSDREKAEAAIAEVLVGLSCCCWHYSLWLVNTPWSIGTSSALLGRCTSFTNMYRLTS